MIQQNIDKNIVWIPIDQIQDGSGLWWSMLKLHEKFPQLKEENNKSTIFHSVNALAGILDI